MRGFISMNTCCGALALGLEQELDGAGVDVADVPGEGDGVAQIASRTPSSRFGAGRDLDDLLVAALHRAVALEEVDDVSPCGVGEDLHLDVPRPHDGLLEEHRGRRRTRRRPRASPRSSAGSGPRGISTRRMPRPPPPRRP
jgi:hypothetical protein